jgi:hypothetical protein
MRHLLHILTRPRDPLVHQMMEWQLKDPENQVEIIELQPNETPDYPTLVKKVFESDSVTVW